LDWERLHFAYRIEGAPGQPNFTGAFVGMACQGTAGTARPADFEYFEYKERSYRKNPFVNS
jgi:xylan 1,4-beta-xylosidase